MQKSWFLGLALVIAGAILTAAGAICAAILDGLTEAYPLLMIFGIIIFIVGIVCFLIPTRNTK